MWHILGRILLGGLTSLLVTTVVHTIINRQTIIDELRELKQKKQWAKEFRAMILEAEKKTVKIGIFDEDEIVATHKITSDEGIDSSLKVGQIISF